MFSPQTFLVIDVLRPASYVDLEIIRQQLIQIQNRLNYIFI